MTITATSARYQRINRSATNEKEFTHILPCQIISKALNIERRRQIPSEFTPVKQFIDTTKKSLPNQFLLWSAARSSFFTQAEHNSDPPFIATNNLFENTTKAVTSFAFTPIVYHLATEYDNIFTCMKNFQDVLQQRYLNDGSLWCDEGVYRIAKELQLLNPSLFENIFLGLGGFYMEKILICCCDSYLQECGIGIVFVKNEIFGSGVVQSFLSGGHCVRGKKGMMMLAETLQQLRLQEYPCSNPGHLQDSEHLEAFRTMLISAAPNESPEWKYHKVKVKGLIDSIGDFNNVSCQKSNLFKFWYVCLKDVVSVLIDLNPSHRDGNRDMYFSSVDRAILLCFFFNRINYKRWVRLYFEDCMALKSRFPDL